MLCLERCTRLNSRNVKYSLFGAQRALLSLEYPTRPFNFSRFCHVKLFPITSLMNSSLMYYHKDIFMIVQSAMDWSHKSLRDPTRGRKNMGCQGRLNILCTIFILSLCSFCPDITYWDATSFFMINKIVTCLSGYCSLLCPSEWVFESVTIRPKN